MQPVEVQSTFIQAAGYQQQTAVLELKFSDGTVYRYFGVPAQTYQDLLQAESKGRYFNAHIRKRFGDAAVTPDCTPPTPLPSGDT